MEISGGTCPGQEKYYDSITNYLEQKHTNTQGSNHRGFMGDCIPTCTNDTKSASFESGFIGGQYSEVFTRAHTVQWEKEMKA